MGFFDKILEFFRKKEYYAIDYDALNKYSKTFKELSDGDMQNIKNVLLELEETDSFENESSEPNDNIVFTSIDSLMETIKETIHQDYRKTYFEAANNNWDFRYFITNDMPSQNNSISICNKLSSIADSTMGSVIYPLLKVIKIDGKYHFWNLLESYDDYV